LIFPPFHITSGKNKGKGIGDQIIELMQKKMNGYNHQKMQLPVSRIQKNCQLGKKICSVVFLKNNFRKEYMHYSIPSIIVPSHGITLLKKI